MATLKRPLEDGGIYHILSRGVDKRKIFVENNDYFRFIHNLYEFNNDKPTVNNNRSFSRLIDPRRDPSAPLATSLTRRNIITEILCFCLMPNHYHLLLRAISRAGLVKFLSRLNTGYAKYFNEKYQRSGALFQSRYKLIPIVNEAHFVHIPYYIHYSL